MQFWIRSGNKAIQKKIQEIIDAIQEKPYEGIGKPEQLKHQLAGRWSRRINQEHRIIYRISDQNQIYILNILSLKGHYF